MILMTLAKRIMHRYLLLLLLLTTLNGCASLKYYSQAVGGELSVLAHARPISEVIDDPKTTPELKTKLTHLQAMREFAVHELALPDNLSYRRYTDLGRSAAMWNVFATPELSLEPKKWCVLIAGCMSYHSYFANADAEREAEQLRRDGYDVYVGGVTAYSTAGWFDDPVLNTMLAYAEPELAGILFHELGHQKLYVPDDTALNESFATTVEREGVRRWLAAQNAQIDYGTYLERAKRYEAFTALVMQYRARLQTLYESTASDADKRTGKRDLFDALRRDYVQWKMEWKGYAGYDRWIENVNNARFLSIGLYHGYIPAFEALLAREHGDLPAFYRAAQALAREPKEIRARRLTELAGQSAK